MRSHDRQVGKLIDVLSRRSDKAFEQFVRALVYTYQDDLAVLLDHSTANNLIQTRQQLQPALPPLSHSYGMSCLSVKCIDCVQMSLFV